MYKKADYIKMNGGVSIEQLEQVVSVIPENMNSEIMILGSRFLPIVSELQPAEIEEESEVLSEPSEVKSDAELISENIIELAGALETASDRKIQLLSIK